MQATMLPFPYCSQFGSTGGGRSSSVTGSPVGSPSPPLTYGHPYGDHSRYGSPPTTTSLPLCLKTNYQNATHHARMMGRSSPNIAANFRKNASKSFTIEAILGIQNEEERQISHSALRFSGAGSDFYNNETMPHLPESVSSQAGRSGNCFNGPARYHQSSPHHHHGHHHHHVPVVDPYICTTQQLSPPCLSPDSTRKDKPSPLRRSYQSTHSPSSADSDQSSNTSSHRLTPKMNSGQHSPISSAKSKRVRTIFTPEQLERLEREFERQQYMVGPERLYLASALQLSEAQVKVWFQNRRIKWRKQHLEMQQARLAKFRGGSDSEESQMTSEDVIQEV